MSKSEDILKIQAWFDGELPPGEAEAARILAESDPTLRELGQELIQLQKLLKQGGETPRELPESPDFYWFQIRREIEAHAAIPSRTVPGPLAPVTLWPWIKGHLLQLGGLAAVCVAVWAGISWDSRFSSDPPALIEDPMATWPGISTMSFYAQNDNISVIWVNQNDYSFVP